MHLDMQLVIRRYEVSLCGQNHTTAPRASAETQVSALVIAILNSCGLSLCVG